MILGDESRMFTSISYIWIVNGSIIISTADHFYITMKYVGDYVCIARRSDGEGMIQSKTGSIHIVIRGT